MADFETAARPYARAVFELASEEGKLDRWQELLQAAAAIAADEQMEALFGEPAILDSDLAKLFVSQAHHHLITQLLCALSSNASCALILRNE